MVVSTGGKTPKMLAKEAELKKPLEQAIREIFTRTQSLPTVAKELGIHVRTLYYWMPRLGMAVEAKLTSPSHNDERQESGADTEGGLPKPPGALSCS